MPPPDKDNQPDDRSLVPRPKGELARAGEEVKSGELVKRGLRDLEKATGPRLLHTLECGGGGINIAWSPDGTKLGSSVSDQTVRVWDALSGGELHTLRGHDIYTNEKDLYGGPVVACIVQIAWAPDGTKLASCSDDKTVRVWDVVSGKEIHTLRGHGSVAWSPDGTMLASGWSDDEAAMIWDAVSGKTLQTLIGWGGDLAWSPDGTKLAINNHTTVWVLDPVSGSKLYELIGHESFVTGLIWSPDGTKIASCSDDHDRSGDNTVKVWDAAIGSKLHTFNGHESGVTDVAWSSDGSKLASSSYDGTVRVWDVANGKAIHLLKGHEVGAMNSNRVTALAWNPDGIRLSSSGFDKTVRLWDAGIGSQLHKINGVGHFLNAKDPWSSDGSKLVTNDPMNGTIKIWSIPR